MCLEAITSVHAAQFASFTSTTGMPSRVHPTGLGYVYVIYMARLANEAATIRRVLEPLFQNFDANNHWSLEKGVAYPVLTFLQSLLEETGENSHLLLSILVKHLDHKSVAIQPSLQVDIVNVTARLGQSAMQRATVSIIGATSDLMKHFTKAFPDALFHQLLVAMPTQTMRLDLERTVFSLSCSCHPLFSPWSDQDKKTSEAVSEIFGASASQKRSKGFSFLGESKDNVDAVDGKLWEEGNSISNAGEKHDSHDHLNSFKHAAPDGKMATSAENMPTNFEAMNHTYNIALLFTRSKADPYLELVEDTRLQAVYVESDDGKIAYGSEEEDVAALKSLSNVEADDSHLKETLTSQFMTKFVKLSELGIRGDSSLNLLGVSQIMPAAALTDNETFTELNGSQSGPRTSISVHTLDILSVKELLEPESSKKKRVSSKLPVPYDQMKSQCEALVTGKQQKMSILHSFKHQAEAKVFPIEEEKKDTSVHDVVSLFTLQIQTMLNEYFAFSN
ncbi:hypothetical protein H0E87_028648 [Populus deltoides]|uniref:Uncharacterized protein n=1 Tax=Populus deltoides TaxID=3696 RepID=A0A8T2WTW5_POPDE|nr:hypothetical protein H0E87_028648 [Populus deltoides]